MGLLLNPKFGRNDPGTASGGYQVRERSVKQLSGGERRRIALALALAFGDLAAARGRLKCNLMVLDEVAPARPQVPWLVTGVFGSHDGRNAHGVDKLDSKGGHHKHTRPGV